MLGNTEQLRSSEGCLLLLGNTDGATAATSGLGMLTTDTEEPVVTETTVSADLKLYVGRKCRKNLFYLLESLQILTELGVKTVGD